MPRRGQHYKGLGNKKSKKRAKVDLVSSPLTEPLQDEDVIVVTPPETKNDDKIKSDKQIRALIASYYAVILNSPPPKEWQGRCGTVANIRNALAISKGSSRSVLNVLHQEWNAQSKAAIYDGFHRGKWGQTYHQSFRYIANSNYH